MRKGKLTQAALSRSVLRVLNNTKENVLSGPEYGCGFSAFRTETKANTVLMTACGSSAGFPEKAPEYAVAEACGHLLAAGAAVDGITVQLVLPEWYEEANLKRVMRRIDETAKAYGAAVLGGHTEVLAWQERPELFVTAVGHARTMPEKPAAGMDLVAVGPIASGVSAYLAGEEKEKLKTCFSERFLDDAVKAGAKRLLPEAVRTIQEEGNASMKIVSRGGILGALWELAEYGGVGLDAELRKIPIRQETVEICEFFSLNPYQIFGTDTLLAASFDGAGLVKALERKGIPSAVIGRLTEKKERVLRNGDECRYLDKPQTDEWYRMENREKSREEKEQGKEESRCQD